MMEDNDEEPVSKKKKSGFAFRQDRKNKQLIESAQHCTRITKFFSIPKKPEDEPDNATIGSAFKELSTQNTTCSFPQPVTESIVDPESKIEIVQSDVAIDECYTTSKIRDVGTSADNEQLDFNFYKKPAFNDLSLYLSFHPVQPSTTELPFIDKKNIFKTTSSDGQEFNRQWLTFDSNGHALFCYICVAFSATGNSVFCSGFKDWRHVHQRVQEHEESKTHRESVEAFMSTKHRTTTHDLLFTNQLETRKQQVMERRHVLGIIIDILKLVGKQGLPFRGSLESALHLADETVNHGNFLEIVHFVGKYDAALQRHLEKIIENSRLNHERAERRKALKESDESTSRNVGRGSFVSFIGKNTVLKIIHILADEIRCQIAMDVKSAGNFSIMMDTTIDISTLDQCAFVVRFVKGCKVFERLLALKPVTGTSAEHFFSSLKNVLNKSGISIEHCIANAFDGASNMSGQYNGVTAKLSEVVPQHVHTWCYAHVLNLVMCDTAECTIAKISFFGLLQKAQVFFKESFKRLQTYLAEKPYFVLEAIGATRWRSRSDAAVKIFGRIGMWTTSEERPEPSKCVYFELVIALFKVSTSSDFNKKVRDEADALLNKFTSFETVFVAMMCLQIFKITTPVSDYLQTKNLDFSQAWRMVSSAIKRLKELREKFKETVSAAKRFVSIQVEKLDRKLETDNTLDSLVIEEDFKETRKRKIKRQAGEFCNHETPMQTRQDEVKVDVFYRVVDTVIQVMERRFAKHKDLYLDVFWFDPRNFKTVTSLPSQALTKLCEHLPGIDKEKLQEELESFIHVWPKLRENISQDEYGNGTEQNHGSVSGSLADEFEEDETQDEKENENEEELFLKCSDEMRCASCIKCVLKVIFDYNMYSLQYTELYKVYKYLLTLPMTQVTCERVFSKLKIIKTRLRSTLTDENLESLMLMSVEREILNSVHNDVVISKLCETSSVMRRLLEV